MAVPAATITFVYGATTVTLPSPAPGYQVKQARAQAIGQTAAGADYVYDKGYSTYELQLTIPHMSDTQKDALDSFFKTTVIGGVNAFTYTDHFSTAHSNCRFLDPQLQFRKERSGRYTVALRLRVTSAVD